MLDECSPISLATSRREPIVELWVRKTRNCLQSIFRQRDQFFRVGLSLQVASAVARPTCVILPVAPILPLRLEDPKIDRLRVQLATGFFVRTLSKEIHCLSILEPSLRSIRIVILSIIIESQNMSLTAERPSTITGSMFEAPSRPD